MRLETIRVRNFRMLRRFEVNLSSESPTTVFVGPNNSGKTSAMDALRLFTCHASEGLRCSFSIHDISQARQKDFDRLEAAIAKTEDADKADLIPLLDDLEQGRRGGTRFNYPRLPVEGDQGFPEGPETSPPRLERRVTRSESPKARPRRITECPSDGGPNKLFGQRRRPSTASKEPSLSTYS